MSTQTKETPTPSEMTEIAVFKPPRLPFHKAITDRFGIEISGWKTIVDTIFPAAKSVDAIVAALAYCKARELDVFKRPVHIVPMWDARAGAMVETIWPGISELRTTAFRTGNYAGSDAAEFGPTVEHTFTGRVKGRDGWEDKTVTVRFPEWCRITVYRDLKGLLCKFVGPKVRWLESYATIGKSDLPNDMWQNRPEGQIEKCAEAAALRKAFPEELGNEYSAEEMSGRTWQIGDSRATEHRVSLPPDDEPPPRVADLKPKPEPKVEVKPEPKQDEIVDGDFREVHQTSDWPGDPDDPPQDNKPPQTDKDGITSTELSWINEVAGAFSSCEDLESFGKKQREVMAPKKASVSKAAWARAQTLAEDNYRRIADNE